MLLINLKYDRLFVNHSKFPVLNGKHEDFTRNWYIEVGSIITLSVFISTALINPIVAVFVRCKTKFIQCCDRKCSSIDS
jgi:hypothetical protein